MNIFVGNLHATLMKLILRVRNGGFFKVAQNFTARRVQPRTASVASDFSVWKKKGLSQLNPSDKCSDQQLAIKRHRSKQ